MDHNRSEANLDSFSSAAVFKPARFLAELGLPLTDNSCFQDARTAVRQEFRGCSKWKRLRCRKISAVVECDRGLVYIVHVGSSVEFDWTWEGATAFRPHALSDDGDGNIDMADFETSPVDEGSLWSGEILEVDERNGCLFISPSNPENPPTIGPFLVRPFDFLGTLDAIYHESRFDLIHDELCRRLTAATGHVHPPVATPVSVGLPHLQDMWQHSWSVLWGPPGTGKTYTTGQQIASLLEDAHERILVVSTTNRATDAVALSVGKATRQRNSNALDAGQILRIGKGAAYQAYKDAGLECLLQGTESEVLLQIESLTQQLHLFDSWEDKALTRKQITELRNRGGDQSKHIFIDPNVRVIAATAFKATELIDDEAVRKMLERGEAPFTTVFIDEAGLISRAATAVLSLLASQRVVLVGDSKQLAPISRISRILPTRQETWLANSGVSHLDNITSTPNAVHVLTEQRRMHPRAIARCCSMV